MLSPGPISTSTIRPSAQSVPMPSANRTVRRVWSTQCRTSVACASVIQFPVTLVT